MLRSYFVTAVRVLQKNRVFSIIHVLGLSIGICASLVIFLLVRHHFTFDQFEKYNDRIYRVVSKFNFSGETVYNPGVTSPMAPAMASELTGFETLAPFRTWNEDVKVAIHRPDTKEPTLFKKQQDIIFADKNYFDIIGYKWLAGSPAAAFKEPYQVVLTQSKAQLYFPKLAAADMIGKQIIMNDSITTTISGIVEDITANTDFSFGVFISRLTLEKTNLKPSDWEQWNNTSDASQLLVKLNEGTSVASVEQGMLQLYDKYRIKEAGDNSVTRLLLQPLSDIHFNVNYGGYNKPIANRSVLYGLLAIAFFLLLLGCINFINLTTAQATQRAKEIGVRKTLGGSRSQLLFQFICETFVLTLIATLVSVATIPAIFKAFSDFLPADLHFSFTGQPSVFLFVFILVIAITFFSGLYPALVLSRFRPALVMKNQVSAGTHQTRQAYFRKALTIGQFVIAQVFIMGTLIVGKQIHYTLNKDLGFKKDAILCFTTNYRDTNTLKRKLLVEQLKSLPEVAMVSLSSDAPSSFRTWSSTVIYNNGIQDIETDVQLKYADTNFLTLYGMRLLAGSEVKQGDSIKTCMINETYAHKLGFNDPHAAIGKMVKWNDESGVITAVLANFHQKSLHEPVKPLMMSSWEQSERTVNVLLLPNNVAGTTWKAAIGKIEKLWKSIYPEEEFAYRFFDQDIARFYEQERNTSVLLKWATGLAILISCLGLIGLVMYTTAQRTKEIGVRKVLGASVAQIIQLISKDFIQLVLLAFVVAVPLAWIGMHQWLENFAYRTSVDWWVFVVAGGMMMVIALSILAFQTTRAATANPVESLRTE